MWRNPPCIRTTVQEENREPPFTLRLLSEGVGRLQEVSGYKEMGGRKK